MQELDRTCECATGGCNTIGWDTGLTLTLTLTLALTLTQTQTLTLTYECAIGGWNTTHGMQEIY